jgi:hypothetical protein
MKYHKLIKDTILKKIALDLHKIYRIIERNKICITEQDF